MSVAHPFVAGHSEEGIAVIDLESKPPVHFLLRYSDSLRKVDTYHEHKLIEQKLGSVWWGKFGIGISERLVKQIKKQIKSGKPTYVYLATHRKIEYRARLLDILGGGLRGAYKPKERNLVPSYYRGEQCSLWFRLGDITPATEQDRSNLVLYNAPYMRPQLTGMRGLIYVRKGKSSPKREDDDSSWSIDTFESDFDEYPEN